MIDENAGNTCKHLDGKSMCAVRVPSQCVGVLFFRILVVQLRLTLKGSVGEETRS